jgi:hypothetical protein
LLSSGLCFHLVFAFMVPFNHRNTMRDLIVDGRCAVNSRFLDEQPARMSFFWTTDEAGSVQNGAASCATLVTAGSETEELC